MKNSKSTLGYFEVINDSTATYEQVLKAAKKQGYNFMFRWINSDNSWTFFQTTFGKAEKAAVELYMSEKKESDREFAKKYYSEYVDIIEVSEALNDI